MDPATLAGVILIAGVVVLIGVGAPIAIAIAPDTRPHRFVKTFGSPRDPSDQPIVQRDARKGPVTQF